MLKRGSSVPGLSKGDNKENTAFDMPIDLYLCTYESLLDLMPFQLAKSAPVDSALPGRYQQCFINEGMLI